MKTINNLTPTEKTDKEKLFGALDMLGNCGIATFIVVNILEATLGMEPVFYSVMVYGSIIIFIPAFIKDVYFFFKKRKERKKNK